MLTDKIIKISYKMKKGQKVRYTTSKYDVNNWKQHGYVIEFDPTSGPKKNVSPKTNIVNTIEEFEDEVKQDIESEPLEAQAKLTKTIRRRKDNGDI
tara:strand:- start:6824 stop:7111 length:288 start_codon:yes stop_codon:yes gene_type:complete